MSRFNLTKREIVALMGAHSVGAAQISTSGMQGWWSETNRVFDNAYFKNMLNSNLGFQQIPINTTGFQTKYQWNATADWCIKRPKSNECRPILSVQNKRIMMNSDMCLHLNFTVDALGKANCDYNSCSINSETNAYVEEFAANEPEFKKVFGEAFEKMVEYGYSGASSLKDL
jgi:catalase (peroxidase I)